MSDECLYLAHHGIKGQKWGYRRWQNADGSLTPEGREHYGKGLPKFAKSVRGRNVKEAYRKAHKAARNVGRAEQDYNRAKSNMAKTGSAYRDALGKYNKTAKKLDKTQNGLYAKLVGINGRKERKLQEKLNRLEQKRDRAYDDYEDSQLDVLDTEATLTKYSDISNQRNSKANRLARNYIKRYGEEEYSNLNKKYSKLGMYQRTVDE